MKNTKLLTYIAKRSKQVRIEKGISQSDVLVDTGIHIGRIEMGIRDISVSTLVTLNEYYEVDLLEGHKG